MRSSRPVRASGGSSLPPLVARLAARLRAAGCVFAEEEAEELLAAAPDPAVLEGLVVRRIAGEPLEQLVGRVRFAGLDLLVEPGVFVPRQRTAHLAGLAAQQAAQHAATRPGRPVVVDLCCGVGAVAAVVAARVPGSRILAADLDPAAVACARRNLAAPAAVLLGDLYEPLPADLHGRVDVLAVNAPYVPTGALALLPREAREHEPVLALDGGPDGLDLHRRVVAGAAGWLSGRGVLLLEVGEDQVRTTLDLLVAGAMVGEVLRGDLGEITVRATPSGRLGSISQQV